MADRPAGADVSEGFAPPGSLPTGTVTFLFTDIEGSTNLLRQAGNAYGDLLAEHRRLLRAAFTAHGGREVDTQGDSFFVAFSSAGQAVAAAVDGQRALADHPWPDHRRVRVRMGLHTGEASTVDGSYVSVAVHRAARIAAAAHGGQLLLSEGTAALVRDELPDGTTLRDLGEHRLKDFDAPARLFQLDLAGLPAAFPPPRTLGPRFRLPEPPGSFVGREDEVAALAALLRDSRTRLVTLTGPGGIGKTRLAIEVARAMAADLPGGVVFVPVAAIDDPTLVIGSVADAVGSRRTPGDDVWESLAVAFAEDRTLLLLDNLEQVVDAAADLGRLLERIPSVVLLVTSRTVLHLRVEQQFHVRPLPEPAAVRLFTERAAAVRPGARVDEDDEAVVADISRRLDCVPLAIELAAARVRLLPPRVLLDRLSGRIDVLAGGAVDLPERQRTLRATMDWSHSLLAGPERALFARLAVFSGGWDLDAAEQVCGRPGEPPVLDTLAALVDASLVVPDDTGEPRFSMLETVRVYAGERLAVAPDRHETERRHSEWVLALTRGLLRARGLEHRRIHLRLDRERANFRTAVQRLIDAGDVATVALLLRNAVGWLAQRDAEAEAVAWLDAALARADGAPPPVRGRLLVLRAMLAIPIGELETASALVAEGEPLLPEDADHDIDRALAAVAGIQRGMERGLDEAGRAVDVALDRFTALGMEVGQLTMRLAAGDVAMATGHPTRAADHYRCAVDLAERTGEDGMLGRALSLLGLAELALGDVAAARRSMLDGGRANRRGGQLTTMAYSLEGLAALALAEERPALAARLLAAADAARGRSARPLTPALPPLVEMLVTGSRDRLGDEEFAAAWSEGAALSVPQALEQGLVDFGEPP